MSRRGVVILVGGLLFALLAIGLLMQRYGAKAVESRPPELGGQQVPNVVYDIRFDQQYDVYCTFFRDEPTVYRNCTILGFTGREESNTSGQVSSFGIFSVASSSGSSYSYGAYFEHWLVLKRDDGRLAYIPPGAVKYIEQAAPKDR